MSRPKVQRGGDRTRQRLLQTAIRRFAQRGYDGVSVDEIVAAARVNKRMVYHYFGSKDELYLAALTEVFGELEQVELQVLEPGDPPDTQLERLLTAYFDFLDAHPEFVRLLLWENLGRGRHIARQAERLQKNPFLQQFTLVLDRGIKAGVFRRPVDRRHLAANLIGLCFIYYSNRYSLAASLQVALDDPADRVQRVRQAVDLLLHGVCAPGERRRR